MSDKHRTQRLCKKCGKIFYGDLDSTLCAECVKSSRSNVMRTRVCQDCGRYFEGGPRAKRCPECRKIAAAEACRRCKKNGAKRHIGSTDICQECGNEYIVRSSMQKYCSDECQRTALLRWQREHKKVYNGTPESKQAHEERLMDRQKVCVYCLRPFWSKRPTNLCSDYCRKEQRRLQQYKSDIKRGIHCDLESLELKRDEFRELVKSGDEKSILEYQQPRNRYNEYNKKNMNGLTSRECQVLTLKSVGFDNKKISEILGINRESVAVMAYKAAKKVDEQYDVLNKQERLKDYRKQYYETNREKQLQYRKEHNKKYYQDNREKLLEKQKERYRRIISGEG